MNKLSLSNCWLRLRGQWDDIRCSDKGTVMHICRCKQKQSVHVKKGAFPAWRCCGSYGHSGGVWGYWARSEGSQDVARGPGAMRQPNRIRGGRAHPDFPRGRASYQTGEKWKRPRVWKCQGDRLPEYRWGIGCKYRYQPLLSPRRRLLLFRCPQWWKFWWLWNDFEIRWFCDDKWQWFGGRHK